MEGIGKGDNSRQNERRWEALIDRRGREGKVLIDRRDKEGRALIDKE